MIYSYDIHGSFDQLAAFVFRFKLTSIESPKIELMITTFIHKKSLMLPYLTRNSLSIDNTHFVICSVLHPLFQFKFERLKCN